MKWVYRLLTAICVVVMVLWVPSMIVFFVLGIWTDDRYTKTALLMLVMTMLTSWLAYRITAHRARKNPTSHPVDWTQN